MTIEIYYAVNRSGQGRVFTSVPVKNDAIGVYSGDSAGNLTMFVMMMVSRGFKLPAITYDDEPVKLKISITNG